MKLILSKLRQKLGGPTNAGRQVKLKRLPPDRWLILAAVILSLFGLLMVYDSSVAIALRDFSDPYHFVRDQLRWLFLGGAAFVIFANISYRHWFKAALPILLFALILLLAVFIPGIGVRALGAQRWLNFRLFVVQPAELAKLALVIYLAA
ncbi:MAG: FtsW/RodA/SpoVE family cell cycle protein, partial [Patescibacteria group bacterium]